MPCRRLGASGDEIGAALQQQMKTPTPIGIMYCNTGPVKLYIIHLTCATTGIQCTKTISSSSRSRVLALVLSALQAGCLVPGVFRHNTHGMAFCATFEIIYATKPLDRAQRPFFECPLVGLNLVSVTGWLGWKCIPLLENLRRWANSSMKI